MKPHQPLHCFLAGIAWALLAACQPTKPGLHTRYEQILPLKPEEGVFAYSRISPDGRELSYASEITVQGELRRTVNLVDLATRRVLFSEPGIDAYWAPDGQRVIFLSMADHSDGTVSLWHRDTGAVSRDIAPANLGNYFSWASDHGRDLILTQSNNYYYLEGDAAVRPYRTVRSYPVSGTGAQPMIARDGSLIATFVDGAVAVRGLEEETPLLETHLPGGKADFSWDGRYIAFHTVKNHGRSAGYEIVVVDLQEKKLIPVTNLPGSAYYPSWTRDGRLSFRYDSDTYRGFMLATDFLQNPAEPLPTRHEIPKGQAALQTLHGAAAIPPHRVVLVNFWAGWCVHCRAELPVLDRLRRELRARHLDAEIVGACEPSSFKSDRERVMLNNNLSLPQVDIEAQDINRFGIQVFPTNLLFVDGKLVERRYGAQTYEQFVQWLVQAGVALPARSL